MNRLFNELQLQQLGFEFVREGGEVYLQLVLVPDEYTTSPYLVTNSISEEDYEIHKFPAFTVAVGGEEHLEQWLSVEEVSAIIERGYL